MSSKKHILLKLVIIFVFLTVIVSASLKPGKNPVGGKNSTKLVRRGLLNGASRNGVTVSNVPKLRNIKRSPLLKDNVGQAIEENAVVNKISSSGTSVTVSMDPVLASSFSNGGASQESARKELMEKVLDSALNKLKAVVINKGENFTSIPIAFVDNGNQSAPDTGLLKAPIKPTGNHVAVSKAAGLRKKFSIRQLTTSATKPSEEFNKHQEEKEDQFDPVNPSGPTVSLTLDLEQKKSLASRDPQYAEKIRQELMQKVLNSAMNKVKNVVLNNSSIPNAFDQNGNQSAPNKGLLKAPLAPIKPTRNHVAVSKAAGLRKKFPTRQLTTSTIKPREESNKHQEEKEDQFDPVNPSGPTVSLTVDPELEKTLASGDPQYAEKIRQELMQKVLDTAMKKLKQIVIDKGGNPNNISILSNTTEHQASTNRTPGSPRRFPTRQLPGTFPIIVRAPSTIEPSTMKPESHNDTDYSTTASPNEDSEEHSRETDQPKHKKSYNKLATVVRLPPIHLKTSRLHPSPNYDDEDRSASKEIIHDILDKDQFWRLIEDDDETSLDDTEEKENEELLRLLEAKAKERQNQTTTTTQAPPIQKLRVVEKTTAKPFDFKVPRRLRPEFQNFFNSVRDFFVNIYNTLSGGPWFPSLY